MVPDWRNEAKQHPLLDVQQLERDLLAERHSTSRQSASDAKAEPLDEAGLVQDSRRSNVPRQRLEEACSGLKSRPGTNKIKLFCHNLEPMSITNFSRAQLHCGELKQSYWMFEVTTLFLANQCVILAWHSICYVSFLITCPVRP